MQKLIKLFSWAIPAFAGLSFILAGCLPEQQQSVESPIPSIEPQAPSLTPSSSPAPTLSHPAFFLLVNVQNADGTFSSDLYFLAKDGSLGRLTEMFSVDALEASPDGSKLVYSAYDLSVPPLEGMEIYTVAIDTLEISYVRIDLEVTSDEIEPTWTEDGKKIVFTQWLGGTAKIYVMDEDGQNVRYLIDGRSPSISSTGFLAFIKPIDILGRQYDGDIFIVDLQQLNPVIEITQGVIAKHVTWSPDGSKLVFVGRVDGQHGIFVVNADGSELTFIQEVYSRDGILEPQWDEAGNLVLGNGKAIYIFSPRGVLLELITLPGNLDVFSALKVNLP